MRRLFAGVEFVDSLAKTPYAGLKKEKRGLGDGDDTQCAGGGNGC